MKARGEQELQWVEQGRARTAEEATELVEFFGRLATDMQDARDALSGTGFPDMVVFDHHTGVYQRVHNQLAKRANQKGESSQVGNSQEGENNDQEGASTEVNLQSVDSQDDATSQQQLVSQEGRDDSQQKESCSGDEQDSDQELRLRRRERQQENLETYQQNVLPMFQHMVQYLVESREKRPADQPRAQIERDVEILLEQQWVQEVRAQIEHHVELLEQDRSRTAEEEAELAEFFRRMAREMQGARSGLIHIGRFPDMVEFDHYTKNFQNLHNILREKNPQ